MKKRIASLFLALMILLSLTACATDPGEIAKDSREGVVRILVLDVEGYYWCGSGFGVGEVGEPTQYFVTNWHVINPEASNGYCYEALKVWIMKNNSAVDNGIIDETQLIPCKIVYGGPDSGYPDVAIIKAAEAPSDRVALPVFTGDDYVDSGDTIYALGYPAANDVIEQSTYGANMVAEVEDCSITRGIVSRRTKSGTFGNTKVIQHDPRISGGNSGGPLINEKGQVVGLNTYGITENDASVAVDITYVIEALDEYEIYYEDLNGINITLIAIIAGIAALIIVVVVVIVVVSSKNKKKAAPVVVGPGPGSSSGPSNNGGGYIPPQPPAPRDGRPRLQCKAGAFVGKRFSLENSVRIGRDPAKNDLVFPANTQGVSGVHCVLMVDGSTVWLKDLGSTYGTYIAGGRRLAANEAVQLHMGDQFWLGSEKELFVIAPQGGL